MGFEVLADLLQLAAGLGALGGGLLPGTSRLHVIVAAVKFDRVERGDGVVQLTPGF